MRDGASYGLHIDAAVQRPLSLTYDTACVRFERDHDE